MITYTGSGTDISLFEGTTQLEYDGVGTANGKWTVTRAGTNITAGAVSKVGNIARVAQHSNMTATPASVTYTISGKRLNGETFSLTKIQSLSFAQQGQDGESIVGPAGPDGKKAVTGVVYFQFVSANAPARPSASSYNIANNTFSGLTAN